MNDMITIRGIVATEPRHLVTDSGLSITSFRLASPSRRWDRSSSAWTNGPTNWFTVTAFRSLAKNAVSSLKKGERVIVAGRLRVRNWERDNRSGTAVEIDADGIGHDLAWGVGTWMRLPRQVSDAKPGQSDGTTVDPATGEVIDAGRSRSTPVGEPAGVDDAGRAGTDGGGGADDEPPSWSAPGTGDGGDRGADAVDIDTRGAGAGALADGGRGDDHGDDDRGDDDRGDDDQRDGGLRDGALRDGPDRDAVGDPDEAAIAA